eukprot:TRINITY_DN1380_c0_g1_i1.p1 TRINITY_DN1380_c0_g1~~TRINITY_DN1380_c0_g1_i1.p1  ORF type:complete len:841 (-),score=190.26 TRINITY_DN1380_c0_g1_i1:30-2552(-)
MQDPNNVGDPIAYSDNFYGTMNGRLNQEEMSLYYRGNQPTPSNTEYQYITADNQPIAYSHEMMNLAQGMAYPNATYQNYPIPRMQLDGMPPEMANFRKYPPQEMIMSGQHPSDISYQQYPSPELRMDGQPSPEMNYQQYPSPEMQMDGQPSPEMNYQQYPSPEMQMDGKHSPEMNYQQYPSPEMQMDGQPSPEMNYQQYPSPEMQMDGKHSPEMNYQQYPSPEIQMESKQVGGKSSPDMIYQDVSTPPSTNSPGEQEIPEYVFSVDLCHRPRGYGGRYSMIDEGEKIRVSTKIGKKLRLIITTSPPLSLEDITISIIEINDNNILDRGDSGFEVISHETMVDSSNNNIVTQQVDLKIFYLGHNIHFKVDANILGARRDARTISFTTHNSGKVRKRKVPDNAEEVDNKKKFKREDEIVPIAENQVGGIGDNYNPEQTHVLDGNLDVAGVLRARGFYQYSDVRLKTNIEDLIDAMHIINSLDGKTYTWKENSPSGDDPGRVCIGLLAQEVYKVAPEVVRLDDDGYFMVNYSELVPVLISAFNQHINDDLEDKDELLDELESLHLLFQKLEEQHEEYAEDNVEIWEELNEVQTIVNNLKKQIDKRRSSRNLIKTPEFVNDIEKGRKDPQKGTISKMKLPLYLMPLIFIIVVLGAAIGILYWQFFENNTTETPSTYIPFNENLVLNPSFESSGGWYPIGKEENILVYDILMCEQATCIQPPQGSMALRLESDLGEEIGVIQEIAVYDEGFLSIEAYALADKAQPTGMLLPEEVPFMVEVVVNKKYYESFPDSIYIQFNISDTHWQQADRVINVDENVESISIKCILSNAVGAVFFDSISVTYFV